MTMLFVARMEIQYQLSLRMMISTIYHVMNTDYVAEAARQTQWC